jgi:hypothetical protein
MKKIFYFPLVAIMIFTSCQPKQSNTIAGTWRIKEYADFDSVKGKWVHPYGDHPRGYFTYTESGIVNLNISSEKPLIIIADSAYKHSFTLGELLDNYAAGYFGTYTIDHENSTVTHHPKGGAIPWYIGTDQPRQFILKGDTLFIDDPLFTVGKRVLIKEK